MLDTMVSNFPHDLRFSPVDYICSDLGEYLDELF